MIWGMILQSKLDVIAVGNLNIDLIGRVKKLPVQDEKLLMEELSLLPGGGAANFVVACSKLGMKSGYIGCIGKDEFGEEILANLRREGVDTTRIKMVDAPTGIDIALSTPRGDHFLLAHRGANLSLKPTDIDDSYIRGAKLLHASVAPKLSLAVGSKAKRLGIKASLDIGAEMSELKKSELLDIIELYDICFMNLRSYKKIFREKSSKEGVLRNFPQKLGALIVTMGSRGAMATDGSRVVVCQAYKVKFKDSTGAGDAFAAAFDVMWLRSGDLEESVKYGLAEAAIKVQHVGAQEGLPDMTELEEFVRKH